MLLCEKYAFIEQVYLNLARKEIEMFLSEESCREVEMAQVYIMAK